MRQLPKKMPKDFVVFFVWSELCNLWLSQWRIYGYHWGKFYGFLRKRKLFWCSIFEEFDNSFNFIRLRLFNFLLVKETKFLKIFHVFCKIFSLRETFFSEDMKGFNLNWSILFGDEMNTLQWTKRSVFFLWFVEPSKRIAIEKVIDFIER